MNFLFDDYHPESIISTIAHHSENEPVKDCLEYKYDLPDELGEGEVYGFEFSDGVSLLILNGTFVEDWTLRFGVEADPHLLINLSVTGGFNHTMGTGRFQYVANSLQGSITVTPKSSEEWIQFPKDKEILFACLLIDREQYLNKIDCLIENMPEKLKSIFVDRSSQEPFLYQSNYSVSSSECVKAILTNTQTGIVRTTNIEGLALELFSYQIRQFKDDLLSPGKQVTLRKQDIEKIIKGKDILVANLQDPPTIEVLAKEVGVNQSKLKSGFKEIFNKPIKTWLRDKRLETAKLLLLEGSMDIKAVVHAVGYTNQSHFARRFKEKYGVLPKDFAKTIQLKLSDFLD